MFFFVSEYLSLALFWIGLQLILIAAEIPRTSNAAGRRSRRRVALRIQRMHRTAARRNVETRTLQRTVAKQIASAEMLLRRRTQDRIRCRFEVHTECKLLVMDVVVVVVMLMVGRVEEYLREPTDFGGAERLQESRQWSQALEIGRMLIY